jgi:hypothetical protein
MNITKTILIKSLVYPFYRQNAGLFAFGIFIMVAMVGRANGVGLLEYHLSLIQGLMTNLPFLLFVLVAWFLYALKCQQFITDTLSTQDHNFLFLLSLKKQAPVFRMLLIVQILLLFPVLIYAFIALWVAVVHHWWPHITIIVFFFILLSLGGAMRYQFLVNHPEKKISFFLRTPRLSLKRYWILLFRYIWSSRKILLIAIKVSTCLILYGLLYDPGKEHSGLQMVILFYSFGLLGHGVLIYDVRHMEESRFAFYRGLPVKLFQRFLQFVVFYLLLLIPEITTILWLAPANISYGNALLFISFGLSTLLFLNSILFIQFFKKLDYLKIVTGLFLFIFIVVLTGVFPVFCIGLFLLSGYIFFRHFYRFEKPGSK